MGSMFAMLRVVRGNDGEPVARSRVRCHQGPCGTLLLLKCEKANGSLADPTFVLASGQACVSATKGRYCVRQSCAASCGAGCCGCGTPKKLMAANGETHACVCCCCCCCEASASSGESSCHCACCACEYAWMRAERPDGVGYGVGVMAGTWREPPGRSDESQALKLDVGEGVDGMGRVTRAGAVCWCAPGFGGGRY